LRLPLAWRRLVDASEAVRDFTVMHWSEPTRSSESLVMEINSASPVVLRINSGILGRWWTESQSGWIWRLLCLQQARCTASPVQHL